jgi:hypothetical protein
MRKLLGALLFIGAFFFAWSGQQTIDVQAKTFNKSFANTLKQGRLPNNVGKVGTKFETIYYKVNGQVFGSESFNSYSTNKATYYYDIQQYETIYYSQKTKAMEEVFSITYSKKAIRKYLKPLAYYAPYGDGYVSKAKSDLYKAGRFYAYIDKSGSKTRVVIATKQAMKNYFMLSKIYE